jgi:CHRD domain
MKGRVKLAVGVAALAAVTAAGTVAVAGDGDSIREELTGYEEDPLVLSTTGNGSFRARIDERQQEISYRLRYADLEGNILQAHIHLGGAAQSGGISVFLCTNLGNGPAGTPLCPPAPGSVSGTLTPASVVGPVAQGIAAGEFQELVDAIRAGVTYANVHSSKYPGGEIRAQLESDGDGDSDD